MLTSLGIHLFPFICMYHFRWFTLHEDGKLALEERRYVTPVVETTWHDYTVNMVVVPVLAYLFWLLNYALVNFVFSKSTIEAHQYWTLYKQFGDMSSVQKFCERKKIKYSPPIFLFFHFVLFFVCHLGALIAYHWFWFNTLIVILYSYISIWNGACFYMDFFCKKYEKLLNEYEEQYKGDETIATEEPSKEPLKKE